MKPVLDYLANAESAAAALGYQDPALAPALQQQALMFLALGYIEVFGTRVESPDWVPHIPFYLPWGSPNPDDIYRFVPMDAGGTYRFWGRKGTAPVTLITMRKGGAHLGEINGRTLGEIDLAAEPGDPDGAYEFILSAERPPGYAGLFYELHADTQSLLYRSRTGNATHTDTTCFIQRLDVRPPPGVPNAKDTAHKIAMLARYAIRQNELVLGHLNKARARGGAASFVFDDQSGYGGVISQRVLMHLFTLAEDEALILESEVPEEIRYWSVQLYDAHFTAIDFVFRQASLNGEQITLDSDGKVRLVVASRDPGVPNWLDCAGWPSAGLLWRWSYANRFPQPSVRKVKFGDLPADMPRIDAATRREQLKKRTEYYQTRGR